MNKTFVTVTATLALVLAGTTATAAENRTSKEEAIGVGSGAVIGAAAAGPFGFVIGAAIGAWVGDSMHTKNEDIEHLGQALDVSEAKIASLNTDLSSVQKDYAQMDRDIRKLQRIARPELVSLMQAGIAMDLLFRTDEAALTGATGERLEELGQALSLMPDVRIQLDGFADERGNDDYNQALSQRRVEFVRDQLIATGIPAGRIELAAHGESIAQDDTIDSLALERRVTLTLYIDDSQSVAAN